MTEPELVRRWWSGQRGEVTECEIDLRVGGKWRYAMRADSSGDEVVFYGEYREIVPDQRIVNTEVFAPFPDDGALNTMTLTSTTGERHSRPSSNAPVRRPGTCTSTPGWMAACWRRSKAPASRDLPEVKRILPA